MRRFTTKTPGRTGCGGLPAIAVSIAATVLIAASAVTVAHEDHGHPARIHEGSCEDLGAVSVRLNGVGGSGDRDNAPGATPAAVNPDAAHQGRVSETAIDASLDNRLAADHAVMIYESDEAMDAIACGNVGGAMHEDTLITALAEAGVPGHVGFALFRPEGDRTSVSVIFGHGLAPVSASGAIGDHDHSAADEVASEHPEGEDAGHDHAGEEEGDHAVATAEG